MSRSKLAKFQVIAERPNVVEAGKENYTALKSKWNEAFFESPQPIVLEIGCGKGDYTVGMAALMPDRNFIGIDIKGSRLWKGSTLAEEAGLHNVGFLRTFVEQLDEHFAPAEVSELWITFPDPRPKKGDIKKRLTSPRFLDIYERIVAPGGIIHFKTDNQDLFEYSLELLQQRKAKNLKFTFDLYDSELEPDTHGIQTVYEKRYLAEGIKIKYLRYEV